MEKLFDERAYWYLIVWLSLIDPHARRRRLMVRDRAGRVLETLDQVLVAVEAGQFEAPVNR